jgi:diaminopimelate decarboxylase
MRPRPFFFRGGRFAPEGIPPDKILRACPTPCYLYSGAVVRAQYQRLHAAFPGYDLCYSLKANPHPGMVRLLRQLGAGAEVSSAGELNRALEAGFNPASIVFVGPGKTRAEIGQALRAGIYALVVESLAELELIESMARPSRVLLRINTRENPAIAGERMVGGASKFGFDEETVVEQLRALRLKHVRVQGIQVYSASQVLDPEFLSDHLELVTRRAVRLSRELGFGLRAIDFGGGFGVPYESGQRPLDLRPAARTARRIRRELTACRLLLESGRFLVAQSGVFITRVVRVKQSRGRTFAITDGGMNHFTRPVFMRTRHEVRILNRKKGTSLRGASPFSGQRVTVAGPLCTPIDVLGEDVLLPPPKENDLIGVFDAGAYGYSMSLLHFLSFALPGEVFIDRGRIQSVRREGTTDEHR